MLTKVQEIKEQVQSFLTRQFLFEFDEREITPSTDLFLSGIIDSFGSVELVTFIETKFKIKLSDEDFLSGSLKSLNLIIKLIEEKTINVS